MLQGLVGHMFTNPVLLTEAITHVLYSQNNTGLSYERLDSLGNAVLTSSSCPNCTLTHVNYAIGRCITSTKR